MKVPIEITYLEMKRSDNIDGLVRRQAAKLEKFCNHISSCRVAISKPHVRQRAGNRYRVRLDVTVPPSHELAVVEGDTKDYMHDDLRTVVRRSFRAMRRQVQELAERQRKEVKRHGEPTEGRPRRAGDLTSPLESPAPAAEASS